MRVATSGSPEEGPSNEALIAQAVADQDEAFHALVDRFLGRIHRFVSRMVGPAWAEDLTQEVFLRAYERRDTYRRGSGSFSSWIYGIARNLSIDFLRRKRPVVSMEGGAEDAGTLQLEDASEPAPPEHLAASETSEHLARAIDALPEPYRTTFQLCVLEGFSYEEAAAVEGCPVKTISSRLARGRARLREQLSRHLAGESEAS